MPKKPNPFASLPADDSKWTEENWKAVIDYLVRSQLLTYKEIAALTLGHLNPSQVGTSIATKKSFQKHFPRRKCWAAVRQWHFNQAGKCCDQQVADQTGYSLMQVKSHIQNGKRNLKLQLERLQQDE